MFNSRGRGGAFGPEGGAPNAAVAAPQLPQQPIPDAPPQQGPAWTPPDPADYQSPLGLPTPAVEPEPEQDSQSVNYGAFMPQRRLPFGFGVFGMSPQTFGRLQKQPGVDLQQTGRQGVFGEPYTQIFNQMRK